MKLWSKVLLTLLYAGATGLASYLVYTGTRRPDYAPTTNSVISKEGELKEGKVLKVGEDTKIHFKTENDDFTIRIYCPQSTHHNPQKKDCDSNNKMTKMVLIKNNK